MSIGRSQASLELILEEGSPPVLTSPNPLSTLLQRFACARLSQPCLPGSCPDFSATLTTIASTAACGGLRSAPDCRPRRTLRHRRLDRRYSSPKTPLGHQWPLSAA